MEKRSLAFRNDTSFDLMGLRREFDSHFGNRDGDLVSVSVRPTALRGGGLKSIHVDS